MYVRARCKMRFPKSVLLKLENMMSSCKRVNSALFFYDRKSIIHAGDRMMPTVLMLIGFLYEVHPKLRQQNELYELLKTPRVRNGVCIELIKIKKKHFCVL